MSKLVLVLLLLSSQSEASLKPKRERLPKPHHMFYKPLEGECFFMLEDTQPVYICNKNGVITFDRNFPKIIKQTRLISCVESGCSVFLAGVK